MIGALPIPGVAFGIYNSPMLLSVGFLVGGAAVAFWLAGGLIANFGIIVGGSSAGLWDVATAQGIVASLGMGLMMGSGHRRRGARHPSRRDSGAPARKRTASAP